MIEDIFYKHYPHLRRLQLRSFKSLEFFAEVMEDDLEEAFIYLVTKDSLHGVEWKEFILIHPDGVIDFIKNRTKKAIAAQRIPSKRRLRDRDT